MKGGPRYGIDFKGGTVMTFKFAQGTPDEAKIRSAIGKENLGAARRRYRDLSVARTRFRLGPKAPIMRQQPRNRQIVTETLEQLYGHPGSGKLDFNNASAQMLKDRLRDPLSRAGVNLGDEQLDRSDSRHFGVSEYAAAFGVDFEF